MGKDRSGRGAEEGGLAGGTRQVFGRRFGRPMRRGRREALERVLPEIRIEPPETGRFDPREAFPATVEEVWLEIGAGNGDHAVWQAIHNPSIGMIAVEPYMTGVANLAANAQRHGVANLRVFADDARLLLERLLPETVARAFILFPDPWPKRRHWPRRIISPAVVAALAAAMPRGAELRVATDHPDYLTWILRVLRGPSGFAWQPANADEWRRRPDDWPETRFEVKGREAGRPSTYLSLHRV